MKKFMAIMLALVLALGMTSTAFAATITIDPNVTGGLDTAETYKAYLIFSANFEGNDPAGKNVSYTIAENSPFYSVIEGFKVTVDDKEENVFKLDEINDSGVYNVTKLQNYDAEDLAAALKSVTTDTNVTATVNSQTDGKYVFSGLAEGYYLITSSLGSKMIVDTFGDVEIATKNAYPSLTKKIVEGSSKVDSTTADRGTDITFEIVVTIPTTVNGDITVNDSLDADMTYKEVTTPSTGLSKTEVDDDDETDKFSFVLDYETVIKPLIEEATGETVTYTIVYTATLNADAEVDEAHTNTAKLTYSQFTSTEVTVNVYTYKVDVYKYATIDGKETGLAGAGFVLMNGGKYYKNDGGVVTWVDKIPAKNTADYAKVVYTTTATNSTITFEGLKNGEYTLVEHVVPTGYNKANDQTITIDDASITGQTQIKVENKTGSELPSTGGMGTTIFYVVGGMMMAAAFVLLITKRKVASEK